MIRAIVISVGLLFFIAGSGFLAAGQLSWPMAWAFLGVYIASKVTGFVILDPDLIQERADPGSGVDRGDVVLATLGYLGIYPGTLAVAGLEAVRLGPAIHISQAFQVVAFIICALGYGFSSWAVACNPFFSTFVRIQQDRKHVVVSSGAYGLVRHPGYAGVLLAHLALPFAFGAIWSLVPAVLGIIFFVLRTAREDRTLQERLAGYRAYQRQVRWRLLPGVW